MSKRKLGVCSVAALATVALAAPAPSHAQTDISEVCDSLIGSDSFQINLGPLARITVWTCKEADLSH